MDLTTFAAKLSTFSRFPEPMRTYAESVAGKLNDSQRGELMRKLEKEYKEFVVLDDKRVRRQAEMVEELNGFKKTHINTLQKSAEKMEHEQAETMFDDTFAEAGDVSNNKKPKKGKKK